MASWEVSLRMPIRHLDKVARHLKRRRRDIELKYLQLCPEEMEFAGVEVSAIVRRPRSVLVKARSRGPIAVNYLSDAIMECLPDDCHDVQVPYWS